MEKPGWKTTEFWLTLVTTAWTMFGGMVPEPYNAILATVITSIYTAARTAGKVKATEQTQVNVKNSEVTVEATKATSVASP